jgi:hypothetical protein
LTIRIHAEYLPFFQRILQIDGIYGISFDFEKKRKYLILVKGQAFAWKVINPQVEELLREFGLGIPLYREISISGEKEIEIDIAENNRRMTFHVNKEICRISMQTYFKISWGNHDSHRVFSHLGEIGYSLVSKIFTMTEVEELIISIYKLTIVSEKGFRSYTMEEMKAIIEETLPGPTHICTTAQQQYKMKYK